MFGPPEVITGRLMSGAGAGPMLAASAQYAAAAAAYEASADRLMAQMTYLAGNWQGATATAMQATVARQLAWIRILQTQLVLAAARTADQAAAFSTAYASMAQMPRIVENRVTTATLHATNFLGVNTIPIAVREGEYAAMWAQDVAVQSAYWAATVANTTFEPFTPAPPMAGFTTFPPVITQALNAAVAAADKVRLAARSAATLAEIAKGRVGQAAGMGVDAAIQGSARVRQAEAEAAVARYRAHQMEQAAVDKQQQAGQLDQQMTQQLMQQLPQQAAQMGQQAARLPQQALQQVQQLGQQFGSQISQLMSQVAPELQVDKPGFFDTHPSSLTLDQLAAGGGAGGGGIGGSLPMTALARVPSLGGLSGIASGFRFPAGWDGSALAAAAAPPPGAGGLGPGVAGRGMGGGMPLHAGRRDRDDEESATITRPDTELTPLWGEVVDEHPTVSPGELTRHIEQAAR
jgi:PPE-repeat protein